MSLVNLRLPVSLPNEDNHFILKAASAFRTVGCRLSLEGRLVPTAATAEAIKSNFSPCSTNSNNLLLKTALSLGQAELNETWKAHFVSGCWTVTKRNGNRDPIMMFNFSFSGNEIRVSGESISWEAMWLLDTRTDGTKLHNRSPGYVLRIVSKGLLAWLIG